MSLKPRQVDFESTWATLKQTCESVTRLRKVKRDEWNDRFSDVYALCVAFPDPLTDRLYESVKKFLESHVVELRDIVEAANENLLYAYHHQWTEFSQGASYLNYLFRYLNSQYGDKSGNSSWMEMTPYSFGIEFQERPLEIGPLALNMWRHEMIESMKETLVSSIIKQIRRDRNGEMGKQDVLQGVIDSFVRVEEYQLKQALSLKFYQEAFEAPLLSETGDYYRREASNLLAENTCSEYMQKVCVRLQEEQLRVRKFLHHSSFAKVTRETEARLVEDQLDILQGECRIMVKDEKKEDLSRMYQLLKPIPHGLKVMLTEIESHIREVGLEAVRTIATDKNPGDYVETLLTLHTKFAKMVESTFSNDKLFVEALDKGCSAVVNYTENPKQTAKSAELLARYCDQLLKKGGKNAGEQEIEDSLGKVIVVFRYVEDKDIFQKFYSKMLAKRLIHGMSVSSEAEEGMIAKLKQMCGFEYTSKLHRMFTDMTVSDSLNYEFSDFMRGKTMLGLNFVVQILQSGAWPLGQANASPFTIPQELSRSISTFESFYNTKFNGRKLVWLHHLCNGELRLNYLKKPYTVTVTSYQMGVLLMFNHIESCSFSEMSAHTQLSEKEMKRTLQSLVDVKLVNQTGTDQITPETTFTVNNHFSNKRTKLKITAAVQRETTQEVAQTHSAIDEDRKLYLQAAVVRIMKSRKALKHNLLIQEVIAQARARFSPSIALIKKCIEALIDKQYLERREDSKDEYHYLA
ncbi:cullin-2-like [Corticium candelabrum]|uniref:cullin-2-like n=1 Tax=Corticium candelabrum TaxID=121492 RepID=UPI002E25F01A|nr:cullin-2-like [Corticium candelabrum]